MKNIEVRKQIIDASKQGVQELIKVIKEPIINKIDDDDDLSADKLKNAAAAKKMAMNDAFEMQERIELEEATLDKDNAIDERIISQEGFAERRRK